MWKITSFFLASKMFNSVIWSDRVGTKCPVTKDGQKQNAEWNKIPDITKRPMSQKAQCVKKCPIQQKAPNPKDLMQGKLFQRCTHLLYCSVLSLGGNIITRLMSKPDMGSIFHINNQWNILVIENYYVNYQNYQNSMLLTSSDTKRTLMHLFLFTNSAQRELVSICTQSIRNCN